MKNLSVIYLSAFVLFVLVTGMACAASTPEPTPLPPPTSTPLPAPSKTPAPTNTPALSNTPAPTGFELDANSYTHPSGAFSFNPPAGWEKSENDFIASFVSPDGESTVLMFVTNTGIELNSDGFDTFVRAMEDNQYTFLDGFEDLGSTTLTAGQQALMEKQYNTESGLVFGSSFYHKDGASIFTVEMFIPVALAEPYRESFTELLGTIGVDGSKSSNLPIYQLSWKFTGPNNSMTIEVPTGWSYSLDDQTYSDAVIETLFSPDSNGLIENISVVSEQPYTMGNAGAIALGLLNDRYSSGGADIRISSQKTLSDGSELWNWKSTKGGYTGFTNFELRDGGKQVLLLSFVSNNTVVDIFSPLFDRVLATYAIP